MCFPEATQMPATPAAPAAPSRSSESNRAAVLDELDAMKRRQGRTATQLTSGAGDSGFNRSTAQQRVVLGQ